MSRQRKSHHIDENGQFPSMFSDGQFKLLTCGRLNSPQADERIMCRIPQPTYCLAFTTPYGRLMIGISSFDELLRVARQQPEPQRLLFVFTSVELPDNCTPDQLARFEAGQGGALTPLMCVDKTPEELGTFSDLLAESRQVLPEWAIVFVAALSGKNGRAPRTEDAEAPLNRMVESIKTGSVGMFIPFDTHGLPVQFGPSSEQISH